MYMKFNVVLEAAEEGGYTVFVPSPPGCISEGDTKEEALLGGGSCVSHQYSVG